MIFLDLDNFRQSLSLRDRNRFFDFGKFQYFLISYLNKKFGFNSCEKESLVRCYAYTGEYTQNTLKKIKDFGLADIYKKRMQAQHKFFEIIKEFNFFEIKTLPLKCENNKIFQKGIDVRIAVDLVYHSFSDNFDIAVICSGDIDLIEAVKLIKNLGKRVILVSHPELVSKELKKEADLFINIAKLEEQELNEFSRIK